MCNCRRLTLCLGNITYIFERLASCCALTSVVTCIMTTMLIMLAIGVGLGYNYCYVDIETGRNKPDDTALKFAPVETHVTTSARGLVISTRTTTTTTTPVPIDISPTMIAPLNMGINFPALINDIRKKKINVTLELTV